MNVNRNKKKLKKRVEVENLGNDFPHTDLGDLLEWLIEKKQVLEDKGYYDLTLNFEYSGSDDVPEIVINGIREETDKEFDYRMKRVAEEKRRDEIARHTHIQKITMEARKLGLIK